MSPRFLRARAALRGPVFGAAPPFACGLILLPSALPAQAQPLEVVVRDERHPAESSREPALSASRVERERLAAPGLDAGSALRGERGVQIIRTGGFGSHSSLSMRGASAAETPVYLAGVRLNDEVSGGADLGGIPLWLVDHVEVYRGQAPLDAGTSSLGGAVLFEPRRPLESEHGVGTLLGSQATRSIWAWAGAAPGRYALLGGVRGLASRGAYRFRDDRGTTFVSGDDRQAERPGSDVELVDGWLTATAALSERAHLHGIVHAAEREQAVPRLAVLPSRHARAELRRGLAKLSLRTRLGSRERVWVETSTGALHGWTLISDPAYELALGARDLEQRNVRLTERLGVRWFVGPSFDARAILDASADRLERRDGALARSSELRHGGAIGARAEWRPWPGASLDSTLLYEASGVGGAHPVAVPTGRVGARVSLPPFALRAGVARGVRFPTLGEQYGSGLFVRGNPELRPELGDSAEVGLRAQWFGANGRRLAWLDADVFERQSRGLVSYVRSAQGYLVPMNVERARVLGLELGGELAPVSGLAIEGAVTLLDPRRTSPASHVVNDVLPFVSRLTSAFALAGRLLVGGELLDRIDGAARWLYRSSRYADAAGLAVIPGQHELELELAAHSFQTLTSRLRATEALGRQRFDVIGYPLPARTLFVSLEVTW